MHLAPRSTFSSSLSFLYLQSLPTGVTPGADHLLAPAMPSSCILRPNSMSLRAKGALAEVEGFLS